MKAAVPVRLRADGAIELSARDRATLGLEIEEAKLGELPRAVLRYGKVRAPIGQEAQVVSPMPGRILHAPSIERGGSVVAGAPMLEIVPVLGAGERVTLSLQGADLTGQIESTKRELGLRETEAQRARELAVYGLTATAALQTAETAVTTTRARLEALEQARRIQRGSEATPITLRAPVDGVIVALEAEVGSVTQAGQVLVRILRGGALWVDVAVPPDDPPGVGYEIVFGPKRSPARLISQGAIVEDDGARRDRLEVPADGTPGLLPGAMLQVRVAVEAGQGVVLLDSAIVSTGDGEVAYVEAAPGVFVERRVRTVARQDNRVRLASGIEPGERVVTRGAISLRGESLRAELRHVE